MGTVKLWEAETKGNLESDCTFSSIYLSAGIDLKLVDAPNPSVVQFKV